MADYLLVVDMQSDYVAVGKAYQGELSGFRRFVCCRSCQPEEIL